MKRGTVLFHVRFRFKNGATGKKLIITLNEPTGTDPYLVVRTTSQQKNRPLQEGCHPDRGVFVLNAGHDWFEEKTWIQLHEVFEISLPSFLQDRFRKEVEVKATLKEQTIRAIVNCLKKSPDLTRYQQELLEKK